MTKKILTQWLMGVFAERAGKGMSMKECKECVEFANEVMQFLEKHELLSEKLKP